MRLLISSLVLFVLLALLGTVKASNVKVVGPPELVKQFPNPIAAHLSPIGYRPLSGRLEGVLLLADPIGACSRLS